MLASKSIYKRTFLLGLTAALLTSCGSNPDKKAAASKAESFIQTYYAQDDVAKSIQYTTGPLKAKLTKEAASIKASGMTEPSSEKPKLTVEKKTIMKYTDTTYAMTWTLKSSMGENLKADLQIEKTGSDWLVSSLVENYK